MTRTPRAILTGVLFSLSVTAVVIGRDQNPDRELRLVFQGNRVFSQGELKAVAGKCLSGEPDANSQLEALDYCLWKVKHFLWSKGYLKAKVTEADTQKSKTAINVFIAVDEGALFRLGTVHVKGSKLLSASEILAMLPLKSGDIAAIDVLDQWLGERVKNKYANFGYIQFATELDPSFHLEPQSSEGRVDFTVTIDEGEMFTIRSINFEGNENVPITSLRPEMLVQKGEVFNKELFEQSLKRIDQTGYFEMIDPDKDVEYVWDKKAPQVDLTIHLKKKPDDP